MTEKVNPSQFRPAEAFKTAGAIGYGGGTSSGAQAGFVTSEPTEITQVDPDIDETALNSFQQSSSASSLDVTIDPGEAFVGGAWLCTDTSTTVSLQGSTTGQTVFVGWDQTGTNEVVIGLAGAFASGSSDSDFRVPLFTFDTDGSGVTNVSDERRLDYSIDIEGSLNFGDDEQASVEYDSSDDILSFDGAAIEATGGHDEVPIPQVYDLVTDDFERASLGSDYVGDTQDAQIQSSVALEGSRSLAISRSSVGASFVARQPDNGVEFGDRFKQFVQLTTDEDEAQFIFFASDASADVVSSTGVLLNISSRDDELEIISLVDESTVKETTQTGVPLSNNLNQTLTVTGTVTVDGLLSYSVQNSAGDTIGSVSQSLPARIPSSGAVQYRCGSLLSGTTIYFDGPFIDRRTTEETRERKRGATETSKLQTRGGIGAGPPAATPNQRRRTLHRHPVTTDSSAEQRYIDSVMVGGSPVAYIEGEFDGGGGSYNDRLNAPLGRFSTVNANLSFEMRSFSDLPYWSFGSGGSSGTASITGRPRSLEVSHDGSGSDTNMSVVSDVLTTFDSLGGLSVMFRRAKYSSSGSNVFAIGISDVNAGAEPRGDGTGLLLTNSGKFFIVENGTTVASPTVSYSPSTTQTIGFEYDGSEARLLLDGDLVRKESWDGGGDYRPVIFLQDKSGNSTGETATVDQITVSPLNEVLQE